MKREKAAAPDTAPKAEGNPRARQQPRSGPGSRAALPPRKRTPATTDAGRDDDYPAAGPHAKPHLTDPDRTPGTGALPDPGRPKDPDATG